MKADDKVQFEDEEGKKQNEKYTNFEYLKTKVEVLQEQIETIGTILKQHGLNKVSEIYEMNPDFEDETYKKLEED